MQKKQTNKKTQSSCGSFKNSKLTRVCSAAADYALNKTQDNITVAHLLQL